MYDAPSIPIFGRWLRISALAVLGFIHLPLVLMVVLSLNDSPDIGLPFQGLSLRWYEKALANAQVWRGAGNGLFVALVSVAISVGFGVPIAILLDRYSFPGKELFRRIVLLPILLPGIVTGVALLAFYVAVGLKLSLWTLALGLGTALICITVTEVFARLQQMGRAQEEAARDMGATEWEVFRHVTFPGIRSALMGAVLIGLAIAFDELAITFLLTGRENTLPMVLWSMIRRDVTPEINAIATLVTLATLAIMAFGLWISRGGAPTATPATPAGAGPTPPA